MSAPIPAVTTATGRVAADGIGTVWSVADADADAIGKRTR